MSLLRTCTVLIVGIALLPSDADTQRRLYDRAAETVHLTVTYCDRNAETCDRASTLWAGFVAKAQFAAGLAYDAVQRYASRDDVGVAQASYHGSSPAESAVYAPSASTLSPGDLRPSWRAPQQPQRGY